MSIKRLADGARVAVNGKNLETGQTRQLGNGDQIFLSRSHVLKPLGRSLKRSHRGSSVLAKGLLPCRTIWSCSVMPWRIPSASELCPSLGLYRINT